LTLLHEGRHDNSRETNNSRNASNKWEASNGGTPETIETPLAEGTSAVGTAATADSLTTAGTTGTKQQQ